MLTTVYRIWLFSFSWKTRPHCSCARCRVLTCFDGTRPECFDLRTEKGVFDAGELGVGAQDDFGLGLRTEQQVGVGEFGDFEIRQATLTCPKKLTRATQLEVFSARMKPSRVSSIALRRSLVLSESLSLTKMQ